MARNEVTVTGDKYHGLIHSHQSISAVEAVFACVHTDYCLPLCGSTFWENLVSFSELHLYTGLHQQKVG